MRCVVSSKKFLVLHLILFVFTPTASAIVLINSSNCFFSCLGGRLPSSVSDNYSTNCSVLFDPEMTYGILLSNKENTSIIRCEINGFTHGIYLNNVSGITVEDCVIQNNTQEGVYSHQSHFNTIRASNISGNEDGIELTESTYNTFAGNRVFGNADDGIDLDADADYNNISGNIIYQNVFGIVLTSADSNTLQDNTVYGHTLFGSAGILVYAGSDNNTLLRNNITSNFVGASIVNASDNNISNNRVCQNIYSDFVSSGGAGNSGSGNYCTTSNGWSDLGYIKCTFNCGQDLLTTTTSTTSTTSTSTTTTSINRVEVVLNEVMPHPTSGDWDWVELYNRGNVPVNLADWVLDDTEGGSGNYTITADTIITAGGFMVFNSSATNIDFNSQSDVARLFNSSGILVDGFTWSEDAGESTSWMRSSDGYGSWVKSDADNPPTPGKSNSKTFTEPLVVGWNLISLPLNP